MLGEVGSDPGQLPRLQHLLGRMWDRARGGRMTMDHYRDAGGWDAGGWDKGLEQHLEEVYTGLSMPQQKICARIFQQLSELDKGRAVRRRAEIGELIEVCGPDVAISDFAQTNLYRQFSAQPVVYSMGLRLILRLSNPDQNFPFSRLYVSFSDSGSTRVSPTTVMKLASATQRGSTCMWMCPATPAPAAFPMFIPRFTPSGL